MEAKPARQDDTTLHNISVKLCSKQRTNPLEHSSYTYDKMIHAQQTLRDGRPDTAELLNVARKKLPVRKISLVNGLAKLVV